MPSKPNKLSLALASILGASLTGTAWALPGVAQIDWMETDFAIIEVSQSAIAYADLVTVHDHVEVPVAWTKWSGDAATRAEYRLDGNLVFEQAISGGDSQSGSATLQIGQGGRYQLSVALCNSDGCSESAPVEIVVADTDGSHLGPIQLNAGENNQPYENSTGSVVGAYFVEWGVYGREFPVDKIPAYNLTHILYGFVPICGGAGINDSLAAAGGTGYSALQQACASSQDFEVVIHDPWAAVQKSQQGHGWATPYKGNFGQLMELKAAYPDLKIVPSIGGWTLTDPFHFFGDPALRTRFVDSVERFIRTWKFFDGVDIDWEYPGGGGPNPNLGDPENDGETYRLLIAELRAMLDRIEADTGRELILTSAVGADPAKIALIDYAAVSQDLDLIFPMTYDYYGAWSNSELGHQTALYPSALFPDNDFNIHSSVSALIAQGVPPEKITVGTAMYGRGWNGVGGGQPGNPFSGTATGPISGTWEDGVLDYRQIAEEMLDNGFDYGYDVQAEAPYLFNPGTGELVTYDDATSVHAKGAYVRANGLAGLFAWEIDADNGDILNAMHEGLGHGGGLGNRAPIAAAGGDRSVTVPATITLDGSASRDPDGDALSYSWTQTGGPAQTLSNADSSTASFDAASVTATTELTFELRVGDGDIEATDSVTLTLLPEAANQPPTVTLPASLSVASAGTSTLSATAADPDGDNLTYAWSIPAGWSANESADGSSLTLTAPEVQVQTDYNLSVTVSDGELDATANTTLTVTVTGGPGGGCASTDPNAGSYPAWQNGTLYTGGDQVSHNDLVWQANWWTNADEPATGSAVWTLQSDIQVGWNAATAYNGGDEVDHNTRRWRAKWWTQGNEPGTGDEWEDLGPASCG